MEKRPTRPEVLGSGTEERDFRYVDDAIEALLLVRRTVELILEILGELI